MHRRDEGQATVLAMTGLAFAVLLLLGAMAMGRGLVERAEARTAADAAALAGAADGRGTAEQLARANGARLERYETIGGAVVVEVAVGRINAFARARRVPGPSPGVGHASVAGPAPGSRAGLVPELLDALAHADRLLGASVPVASGLRSRAQQQALWERRHLNPYPVARPGTSKHEQGRAVDIPLGFVPRLLTVASAAGLCQPLPQSDPVHFEVCR